MPVGGRTDVYEAAGRRFSKLPLCTNRLLLAHMDNEYYDSFNPNREAIVSHGRQILTREWSAVYEHNPNVGLRD